MTKFDRAIEVYQQEGARTLLNKSISHIRYKIRKQKRRIWVYYYIIKSLTRGSDIVKINGILIDLDDNIFSPTMKRKLRSRHYEQSESNLIDAYLRDDHSIIDLGAGVGYTTSLLDKKSQSEQIIAVEANELLIPVLERTKNLNDGDFDIIHSAYHPNAESIDFHVAEDFWSSSQHTRENKDQNKTTVRATSIKKIIEDHELKIPVQLIVDIEGAEHNLLTGEKRVLQNNISLLILEYHDFTERDFDYYDCILIDSGFERIDSQGNVYVYKNSRYV